MHSFHLWCFNDEWNFGESGVVEDIGECCCPDVALPDVFMSIDTALIFRFCVIEMKGFESLKPDDVIKQVKSRFSIRFGSHVVASSEDVAGIETDPEPIWAFGHADHIT